MKFENIVERLDVSDKFWQQFKKRDEHVKKLMGLYENENINNSNICTIAINQKEYFEKFQGMNFESYTERIKVLREVDCKRVNKKMIQKRLLVKNTEMKMASVSKVQFANLNDRQYYFSDGIVSLPFAHPLLSDLPELKKSYPKIHTVIEKEKKKLLKMENQAVAKNERILRSISAQPMTYYKLSSTTKVNQKDSFQYMTT